MSIEVTIGATVATSDGRQIGKVKKIEKEAFLVDAPRQLDYWLHTTLAKEATKERVE
jgi:hypothetical protein